MKKILAIAVATAISAPAMADLTIYGGVAVDYISKEVGSVDNSQVQRDDVIFGMKGASETDGGLIVGGEIKTEGNFAAPTLAYLKVGTEMATLWAGKFGNPADAADAADFSDTNNITHIPGEIDNAVALTVGANGLSAGFGVYQAAPTSAGFEFTAKSGQQATTATDTDGTVAQIGYAAGGVSANVGYHTSGATKTTGVKVGYAGDNFSVAGYQVSSDNLTVASGSSAGTYTEVTTTGVTGSYTMGMTTLSAVIAEDDAETQGSQDVLGLKAAHKLGGGLTAYAEYGNLERTGTTKKRCYYLHCRYVLHVLSLS